MTKILGIEVEPIENFVKGNFYIKFSLFKRKIPKILEQYNSLFDSILKTPLTYRQKTAVILNEKRNLVIAGAGTGKTTTIVAKVYYLVKSGICDENKILVLAFARNAQKELQERLTKLGLNNVTVKTFHALGLSILTKTKGKRPNIHEYAGQLNLLVDFLDQKLKELFDSNKKVYESLVEFNFFNSTQTYENSKHRENFNTIRDYNKWLNSNRLKTINKEVVKSFSELRLANYLTLLGVSYKYEAKHQDKDIYPDFKLINEDIYIELWGIDRNGKTAPHIDNEKYLSDMERKRQFYSHSKSKLIEIYYYEMIEDDWREIIKKKLKKYNIRINPLSKNQIKKLLFELGEGQKKIEQYKLYTQFLSLYKSKGSPSFDKLRALTNNDFRSNLFLDIFEALYFEYERALNTTKSIDYADMINQATEAIKDQSFINPWNYIIIDEFQDTSWDQYKLINNLLRQSGIDKESQHKTNKGCRLYCVGDDWQAINRFRGADYNLMINFRKYLGIEKWLLNSYTRIELDETFRFNDKIAHTSQHFILKNKNQINKSLKTFHKREKPAVLLHWSSQLYDERITSWITNHAKKEMYRKKDLMILYRYQFHRPEENIIKRINQGWKINGKVDYFTCHGAKGLESDVVLIIDLHSEKHGFPSIKENDPLIDLLLTKKENFEFAEERRLFYVALTRARFETHLLCDNQNISEFAEELKDEEYYLTQSYNWDVLNEKEIDKQFNK